MFKGSFVALLTPFRDGIVDETAYRAFVEWQIGQGTHGLVPCGTTGESPTLSHAEHMRVVELCIEVAKGQVPVIAGTGSNSTEEAILLTRHAKEAGANAALVVTPYYNKPSQEGLFQHYKAINDAVEFPVIIYNIPGRSVIDMSAETMGRLAALPNIIGVKDATGKIERVTQQRLSCGEDFIQLSGEDATALAFNAHGDFCEQMEIIIRILHARRCASIIMAQRCAYRTREPCIYGVKIFIQFKIEGNGQPLLLIFQ